MKATFRQAVKTLLMVVAVTLSLTAQAERRLLDQVVAIVDDDVVLQSQLQSRVDTITGRLQAQGTRLPPGDILEQRVLDQLITESIQLQKAEKMGMRISDNELNETLASIAQRNDMTLAQFEKRRNLKFEPHPTWKGHIERD